jgi:hypothetical protein
MDVKIKDFGVNPEIGNKGIEVGVNDGKGHLGDLYVTKSSVIWCKGNTTKANGLKLSWKKFIELVESTVAQ